MEISVVIPAFNEENRIENNLKEIISYCDKNFSKHEIIVVDDCSNDNTNKIVSKFNVKVLKNKKNMGKGYSVKQGILNAKYPLVMFTDSDLATPIKELKKLIQQINKGFDIAIASRNMPKSDIRVSQPLYRQIMGKTFPMLVNTMLLLNIKDTQCGFKLFNTEKAKKIIRKQTLNRFAFDAEMLFLAKRLGYSIAEVPVVWIDKQGSTVNPLRDAPKMFVDILKIRSNSLLGRYDRKV